MFYSKLLERAFADENPPFKEIIDVGCRNWSYAAALSGFFSNASLLGIEVDGGRRYWNLFRRTDLADSYALTLRQRGVDAKHRWIDFRALDLKPEPGRLFTFFYPFVSDGPCSQWGLPARDFADYELLIDHALRLSGSILSVHQGEWEAEIARSLYKHKGLKPQEKVFAQKEFASLWPSPYDAFLFLLR